MFTDLYEEDELFEVPKWVKASLRELNYLLNKKPKIEYSRSRSGKNVIEATFGGNLKIEFMIAEGKNIEDWSQIAIFLKSFEKDFESLKNDAEGYIEMIEWQKWPINVDEDVRALATGKKRFSDLIRPAIQAAVLSDWTYTDEQKLFYTHVDPAKKSLHIPTQIEDIVSSFVSSYEVLYRKVDALQRTFQAVAQRQDQEENPDYYRVFNNNPDNIEERSYRMGPVGPYIDSETGDSDLVDVEDEDLLARTIDLGASRRGNLDESFLGHFGGLIKLAMHRMFGRDTPSILVRGTKSEIDAFANTLTREKRYLESYQKHGLDDPRTLKNKGKLENAVSKFERETGLTWPFRD